MRPGRPSDTNQDPVHILLLQIPLLSQKMSKNILSHDVEEWKSSPMMYDNVKFGTFFRIS